MWASNDGDLVLVKSLLIKGANPNDTAKVRLGNYRIS